VTPGLLLLGPGVPVGRPHVLDDQNAPNLRTTWVPPSGKCWVAVDDRRTSRHAPQQSNTSQQRGFLDR
jgi:hypothetical protein